MPAPDSRKVFVVYGRNKQAMQEMFAFLRMLNLSPTPWEEAVLATHSSAPYIGETLDQLLQEAQAVVVLLTGDDEARLRGKFALYRASEDDLVMRPQPRANVLFETGMVLSHNRLAPRTILVELGQPRISRNLEGRHRIKLSNKMEDRWALIRSLQKAGCTVNIPEDERLRNTANFNFD